MCLSFGKENHRPISPPKPDSELEYELDLRDSSLAEELASVRQRRERLREEREKTEKELREKDLMMARWAMDLEKRAEEQRNLELELRLLIKLQDLRYSSSVRIAFSFFPFFLFRTKGFSRSALSCSPWRKFTVAGAVTNSISTRKRTKEEHGRAVAGIVAQLKFTQYFLFVQLMRES